MTEVAFYPFDDEDTPPRTGYAIEKIGPMYRWAYLEWGLIADSGEWQIHMLAALEDALTDFDQVQWVDSSRDAIEALGNLLRDAYGTYLESHR